MPDILTHVLAAHLIVRAPNVFKNKFLKFYYDYRIVVYFGTILPDLITKPLPIISSSLYNFTLPLHSPFCVLIECCIISMFFYVRNRKTSFIVLASAAMLHILLDNFQKGIYPGYQLLFPFSFRRFGFNIISSEMYLYLLGCFIILTAGIEIFMYIKLRKSNGTYRYGEPDAGQDDLS